MIPLLTAESIIGTTVLKAACAFSLSPALTAAMTFLMNVRKLLRCPALRIRLFSACRARFLACAVLAIVSRLLLIELIRLGIIFSNGNIVKL